MSSFISKNAALRGLLDQHLAALAAEEGLAPEAILAAIEKGTMVLLGNPAHPGLKPILVGQPARIKVNANIGTSPLSSCMETERRKLKAVVEAGTDTVMDLSIAGDLDAIRQSLLADCPLPLGTVPMYAVGQQILDADREISSMSPDQLFEEMEKQAKQGVEAGVDFLCYLTPAEHLTLPDKADARAGVMASRVAAHAGEVALGTPRALKREADMNAARKALDWDGMARAALDPSQVEQRREPHKKEEVCAMCGKFCAVKMLRRD